MEGANDIRTAILHRPGLLGGQENAINRPRLPHNRRSRFVSNCFKCRRGCESQTVRLIFLWPLVCSVEPHIHRVVGRLVTMASDGETEKWAQSLLAVSHESPDRGYHESQSISNSECVGKAGCPRGIASRYATVAYRSMHSSMPKQSTTILVTSTASHSSFLARFPDPCTCISPRTR